MADKPKLQSPLVAVVMKDGSEYEVQTYHEDLVSWDRIRYRRKWPPAADAMWIFMSYVAWNALTREGQIPEMTLDEFEKRAAEVRPVVVEGDDDESGVGPTPKDHEPT